MSERVVFVRHYIGGAFIESSFAEERFNPSDTRESVAHLPHAGRAEVDAAVAAARGALADWYGRTPEARADLLDRIGALVLERRDTLGCLLSREEGKTLAEGISEVARAGRIFRYFAGEAVRAHGRILESSRPRVVVETRREPVGVCALIAPWNFPIAIPAWKSAPALAFGNTVVLKPANLTSATAYALAELVHEAGVPPGVFNVVFGDAQAGRALVSHRDVDAVSFTGSQVAGRDVLKRAALRGARVQLEMGGKNPLVVMEDADLSVAVGVALDGCFFATGQRCTASSRLLVHRAIHDAFVESLARHTEALRVGHALAPDTQLGPAASESQAERSLHYAKRAVAEGARLAAGGLRADPGVPGHYVRPTLLVGTTRLMEINRDEVFGPVASVVLVGDLDEAIAVANDGDYGLSAGIVTASLAAATQFKHRVRAGMVMVNLPTAGVDYHVPFGGLRGSSYGPREQGFAAVEFYTSAKTAYVRA